MTSDSNSSEQEAGTAPESAAASKSVPKQTPAADGSRFRLLVVTNIISIAMAIVLFLGLVYSWTATSELRRIQADLGDLEAFETRLNEKINLMNTGFQNRLERTDDRIESLRSELMTLNATLQETGAYLENEIRDLRADTQALSAAAGAGSSLTLPGGSPAGVPAAGNNSFAQQPSAMFRRVVTPDGKVRYEKRR
ncbi:hypothetical protein [Roseibium sp.]|uniref:hypothetical protein n=1 Tax=Roseibium sp. TaxID=1936156 RepID=UPI003D0E5CA9